MAYGAILGQSISTALEDNYWSLNVGTVISKNSDLNDYTTVGNYSGLITNSNPLTNAPSGVANGNYFLKVMKGSNTTANICQLFIERAYGHYFYREYNATSGTWNTWKESAMLNDINLERLGITVTAEEINYLDGVTSNIQTQLNSLQPTITGGASTITTSNLTASRALVSNSSGKVAVSAVTATELGYLDGVKSNIQTQFARCLKTYTNTYTGQGSSPGLVNTINVFLEPNYTLNTLLAVLVCVDSSNTTSVSSPGCYFVINGAVSTNGLQIIGNGEFSIEGGSVLDQDGVVYRYLMIGT